MAKLIAIAAVLVVMLAVTEAFRATITTVVDDESREQQQQQCRQQIQQQSRELIHCAEYLSQEQQSITRWRRNSREQQQSQHLDRCCNVLDNIDNRCQCDAIEAVFKWQTEQQQEEGQEQQQRRGQQYRDMRQMLQKAKNLPRTCNLDEPQQCQIESPF